MQIKIFKRHSIFLKKELTHKQEGLPSLMVNVLQAYLYNIDANHGVAYTISEENLKIEERSGTMDPRKVFDPFHRSADYT